MPRGKKNSLKIRRILHDDPDAAPMKIPQDHIVNKIAYGLAKWAIKRMGEDFKDYLSQAREDFLFDVYQEVKENPTSVPIGLALIKTPLMFPPRLRKRSKSKYHKIAFQLFREFQTLLPFVQKIKRKARAFSANAAVAFKEQFPGVPEKRLERYREMEPADIVYDYLVWKYSLDLEPETLKEYLAELKRIGEKCPGLLEVDRTIDLWLKDAVHPDSMVCRLISNPYLFRR